MTRRRLHELIS